MRIALIFKHILKGDRSLSPFCIIVLAVWLLAACEGKQNKVGALYTGPLEVVNDVEVKYSEQGKLKVVMKTPRRLAYQNEAQVFPDTININFYDTTGTIVTRLRSDSGHYDKAADVYIVKGNVRVVKSETEELLTTTELNWSPRTRKVFTEKPLSVINKRTSEITNAIGMDAEQDFTRIKFRKATGIYKFSGTP
ncbi:LPS export ABC transporter periplasmic protein LptC [Dyadobacter fanqingshengii]|uniref:LPS export ABC transporter periplasmic protein LptC n=1 Tax=Dyadobacter fanqingshengii TaxID=2906443 RepID=A0A9X1P800_9BACT|nr:LPS export ABC transporter periplasmic protein LptC [Dyadobacter fanqingshengii]MCF0039662.1 LPS export ABC transporter periplasmic protein LptC [Dyadobacter fanqingshengii]MCF2502800.1 LPS export ABC transporter periplasmic protein LptC [Dyadobacter fanqingshengii]USJ38572.1 LPS export ABC transporter periplasmic protein LptC [Dyadobacter fanqingshengii]